MSRCFQYCCTVTFSSIFGKGQMVRSPIIDHFVKICLLFIFSQQNWGYLTRSNLELGILIIPGFCKKRVYQYVVVAKMK
jgi:hypothetical protein